MTPNPLIFNGIDLIQNLRKQLPQRYAVDYEPSSDVFPNGEKVTSVTIYRCIGKDFFFTMAKIQQIEGHFHIEYFVGITKEEIHNITLALRKIK